MPKTSKPPPLRSRSEDKEKRRAEIIEAGVRLIARGGLDKMSFGELAEETRLSRPLIYFYFKDKQSLYREAVCEAHHRLHELFVAATRAHHSGLEQITAIGRSYVEYHAREPHWFYMCADYESHPETLAMQDSLGAQILQHKKGVMLVIQGALEKGIRDGSIRPDIGDVGIVGLNLWAFSLGLIQTAGAKSSEIAEMSGVTSSEMIDTGFDLMRYMLARKPGRVARKTPPGGKNIG